MNTKNKLIKGLTVLLALIICACGSNKLQSKLDLGNKYLEELKYEDALANFLLAIEIDEKAVDAYIGASTAYIYMGDLSSAKNILMDGQIATNDGNINNMITDLEVIPNDSVGLSGHFYKVFNESFDWYSAEEQCVSMGGHLISINNSEEQAMLTDIITAAGMNMYWGGLYLTDGDWAWTDGSDVSYTNWAKDEPNFLGAAETALQIYAKPEGEFSPGEWNDSSPGGGGGFYAVSAMGYVCEWVVF